MNKKTIIILSTVLILLLAAAGGVFWFSSQKSGGNGSDTGGGSFPSSGERNINGLLPGGKLLPGENAKTADFIQIVPQAVAGAAVFSGNGEQSASTTIRYIEKSTGNIYEVGPHGKDRTRITNTTILKIFESFWSPGADKVVIRYLDDDNIISLAKTFSVSIKKDGGEGGESSGGTTTPFSSLAGVFLPKNTTAVAVSPAEDKVFYLNNSGAETTGIIANFDNEKQKVVFSMPFGGFNVNWPNKNIISLLTKPSGLADGFLYFLNPKTAKMEKILGKIKGLTALVSPSGENVIYSQSVGGIFNTKVFDVNKKSSRDIGLKTIPEKCVWGESRPDVIYCGVPNKLPSSKYPDTWYQGLISFNDSIWSINISTGETKMILKNTGTDVTNPFWVDGGHYLVFMNKKDNTLWSLRIR
ncbi:MAG TPA: hypothetical protein ENG99_00700 [bacterium]|nr:hypothetical protein [bacterium]